MLEVSVDGAERHRETYSYSIYRSLDEVLASETPEREELSERNIRAIGSVAASLEQSLPEATAELSADLEALATIALEDAYYLASSIFLHLVNQGMDFVTATQTVKNSTSVLMLADCDDEAKRALVDLIGTPITSAFLRFDSASLQVRFDDATTKYIEEQIHLSRARTPTVAGCPARTLSVTRNLKKKNMLADVWCVYAEYLFSDIEIAEEMITDPDVFELVHGADVIRKKPMLALEQ